MVIDKPAGMTVHPGAGQPDGTLVNALIAHCGDSLSGIGGVRRPGIVHRLDKDTSGLIVAAKSDKAHAALAAQFEARTIKRAYHAFVWGAPMPPEGDIKGNIGRSRRNRTKMAVVSENQGQNGIDALPHDRAVSAWPRHSSSAVFRLAAPTKFACISPISAILFWGIRPTAERLARGAVLSLPTPARRSRGWGDKRFTQRKSALSTLFQVRLSASQVRYPKTCNWSEIALFPT